MTTGGATTTTTTYVGSLAEYTTTGGTTTSTDYLYAAGKLVAEAVTSSGTTTLTYLVTNAQGTPLEALDGSGNVSASRLYTPYGGNRYTSDAFLTNYGYTGQRNDATSGLDYYGARYYDPAIAQFTSADTVLDGLSRYGYVGGNPTSATDPSGHQTVAIEIEPGALGGIVSPEGIALGLAGLAMVGATSATTTAIPLAGTPDPASTYRVGDATVVVTGTGDLVVTVPGKGLGSTTTRYSPGEAGYLQWSQAVSASIAVVDTEVYNARTAPTATTTTTTGSLTGDMVIAHAATGAGDGASTPGAGRGNPAASSGAAAGGSTEPPEGDDCTCGTVPGGSGTGAAANPLENVRYTGKVQSAMGNRWASRDYFHAFPDVVDNYGSYGETFPVPGGDGTVRTGLRIPGGYRSPGIPGEPRTGTWYDGVFECIIEHDGSVNHRLFRPC